MTEDELKGAVMPAVKVLWPHAVTEDLARGYWWLLAEFDAGQVVGAIRELAVSGREFPPPAGVVHAAVTYGVGVRPEVVAQRRALDRQAAAAEGGRAVAARSARQVRFPTLPRRATSVSADTLDT